MLRALAILLSLVCLNAQAPEDAHIISIPHDAICPQTQVNEALETGYKNCIQGTDGGNCKEFLRKVTIWVIKAFEELQKLTPAHERTSQSRAPQDHDIEMGLLESELPKCAEETVPRESIKEFCVKVYEAFRTALVEIVDQTPILSAAYWSDFL
ncbi:unnamed protein product [Albugo candida]|uniref:Saposin B-type domain-containing protein n=1 Tax=Albugo candida TaxID=65357 RepID=A0A024GPN3_9STRA|nr:unnamed protein product [Albugo candida]|eukprot:CCI48478.1 unnamed protein product [Albugo candida]